jgi:putative copper export protein
MSGHDIWQAVLYLHLLAMAFFVGGQLVFGIAVVPILRGDPDRERLRAVARRFGYGSLIALGVLLVTGWAMASHYGLWDSSTLQWKLGFVGLVVALTLVHLRRPKWHALQGGDPARLPGDRLAGAGTRRRRLMATFRASKKTRPPG